MDGDDLILAIRLTPKSDRDAVGGLWTDAAGALWLSVQVRAVPEKGKANTALIALLANVLDSPRTTISMESGDLNRLKRVRIAQSAHAAQRLQQLVKDYDDRQDH